MNSTSNGHVFVVDDNTDIRIYLTDLLRQMGYSVESFDSAESFLAQSFDIFPAVLVLDVRMPHIVLPDTAKKHRANVLQKMETPQLADLLALCKGLNLKALE
jgi:FixJ family two-component response regulator